MTESPTIKRDVIDVTRALIEEIPGGGILSTILDIASKRYKEHQKRKIDTFINTIMVKGLDDENLKDEDNLAHFITMLKWLDEEDETAKAALYGKAFLFIVEKKLGQVEKNDFLRAFKNLAEKDFETLKKLFEVKDDQTTLNKHISSYSRETQRISISRLRLVGALSESDGLMKGRFTSLGEAIVNCMTS